MITTKKQDSKLFILIFLGMLSAFGPFVMDMYLPTLPAMSDYFHTTSSMVQLGLTSSMVGLAIGQLIFGPLSDKYGRQRPLIIALFLFLFLRIFLFSPTKAKSFSPLFRLSYNFFLETFD